MERSTKLEVKMVFDYIQEELEKSPKTTYGKKELSQFLDKLLIAFLLD